MKDGDTLADYPRLKDKANVFLTFRLKGGECNICCTDTYITLPCKHNYCVGCLINQVKTSTITGKRPSLNATETSVNLIGTFDYLEKLMISAMLIST